jgi:WD40 repeat protein
MDVSIAPEFIVARSRDGTLRVHSSTSGEVLTIITGETSWRNHGLSLSGNFLFARKPDEGVAVWQLPDGEQHYYQDTASWTGIGSIDISPDGRLFAIVTEQSVSVWNTPDKQRLTQFSVDAPVRSMRFSGDGKQLVVVTRTDVHIHDPLTGERLAVLEHQDEIRSRQLRGTAASLSKAGNTIATLSRGRVRIWAMDNGRELARIGSGDVIDMRFSPDGRWLLSGNADNTATLWQWRSTDLIEAACSRLEHNLTAEEWSRFLIHEARGTTCVNLPQDQE